MNRWASLLRASSVVVLLALCCVGSIAAAAEKYVVMALVGDELTVVTYQPSVGTNLNSNPRQVVPLRDDAFDEVALRSAEAAIHRAKPDAPIVLLASSDKALYAYRDALTVDGAALKSLLAVVKSDAEALDARYLVLITKAHGDTRLAFRDGPTGQGQLSGLGFYFDRDQRVVQVDTGEESRGFLSSYAYLSVTLVDLQTGAVIRTRTANESASLGSSVSTTTTHPWDAVPATMKVGALNNVIRKLISTTVPQVLPPA